MVELKPRPEQVERVLAAYRQRPHGRRVYLAPDLPARKVRHAIETYAPGVEQGEVLALLDDTVSGNGKDGGLLTASHLYGHDVAGEPVRVRLAGIQSVRLQSKPGTAVVVDGREVFRAGLVDGRHVQTFADLVRDVAHPDRFIAPRAPEVPSPRTTPAARRPASTDRDGGQVPLELLHLTSTQWRGDWFEKHGTGSYQVSPLTLTRPERGVEQRRCHCRECPESFNVAVHSEEEVRRVRLRSGLVLLAGVLLFAGMWLTDEPTAHLGTAFNLFQAGIFVVCVVLIGGGGWFFKTYLDLTENHGVEVGRLGGGVRAGFATHVLRLRK